MLNRDKLASTVKDAADKAGALVMAALVVACVALLLAGAALAVALKVRPAHV